MLINLFNTLKDTGVPCTLRELLDLLTALDKRLVFANTDEFYFLSRAILVKDEKNYDKFDRAFDIYFKGLETLDDVIQALIPDEWLRKEFEKFLTPEELEKIKSMGGLEKLLDEFKKRLEEQKERHEGGDKWVGTGGTSPYGNSGMNPEGIRVDGEGKEGKAVKVWQKRDFKNLDDSIELGTRNIKIALRRLRKFVRESHNEANAVKVIVLFDVGGSMDPHVKICEELFSACKTEFKNLEYFYFHNFIYETVWKDNSRRHNERIETTELFQKYSQDYKIIFIGDATMAPYEITNAGGSIEHWNEEPGSLWMKKFYSNFEKLIWLNPVPQDHWDYSASIELSRTLIDDQMFPLTIKGLEDGMSFLTK